MGVFEHKYPYENFHELNLDWILEEIKKFDATLKSWEDTVKELQQYLAELNQYDARISALERATADLDTIRENIATLQTEIEVNTRDIENLKNNWGNIQNQITDVYEYINACVNTLNQKINSAVYSAMQDYNIKFRQILAWMDELARRLDEIDTSVLNPWHWGLGRISQDKNVNFIYNDLADECLTAEQYCSLGLSSSDYDKFDLSARDYAEFGKTKLHFNWVYMPVEGIKQNISNVLTSIINHLLGTFSASEYAALDLDADDYAALDLTAAQYMAFNVNGTGLTADDYAALNKLNSGLVHA